MRAVWLTLGASSVDVLNDPFSKHDDGSEPRCQNGTVKRGRFYAV
jgi:hypothetical protein